MKHLKDHIRELKINSKGFPYSEIDEISLEYSKNNLLLSEELQNIYLNQLEIYNNSWENELNWGINKILQTYSIDLQCVWEYLSSWPDNDILNESINDCIEKYVSDSESSDNENIRSKPKLEFGNYLKHWTFTNNSVDYYVPAVGMYNISIMPHEKDIINQALEFGDIFPDNYDSEKQIWVHESNSKPIEIEGNGFELCFDVYKIDKQVSNKINKSKKRDHKQFKKAWEKSLEIIHSSLYSSSNNEFARNISQHLERQSFESYIWSSFDKNKVLLESFYSDAPTEFPVFPSSLKLISDGNPFTILSQVAEVLFGSCPKFLESKSDLNKNIKKILAEIKRRHNSIVYFWNNSILSKKISKKLWDQIIEPLIYEMSHTLLNSRKESVAGFQYKFQLAKQVIIDFPFEATIVTNSSMGRLYIIENYNRLTSHPDFIKSKTASHIFGFSLSSNDEVSSKYIFISLKIT